MNIGKHWLLSALILSASAVSASDHLAYQATEPAELSASYSTIRLKAVGAKAMQPDPALRWTLKLSGIWASQQPSSTYALYLNLPRGAQPTLQDAGYVGALSTYDIPQRYNPQHPRKISYDLQPVFARLKASGRLDTLETLTLLPVKPVETKQSLHIEQLEIYRNEP